MHYNLLAAAILVITGLAWFGVGFLRQEPNADWQPNHRIQTAQFIAAAKASR